MKYLSLFVAASLAHGLAASFGAEQTEDAVAARIPRRETGFEGDHLTGDWKGYRTWLVQHGIHFSAGYTAETMANVAGGIRRGATYNGLLEMSLDLDIKEMGGWSGGFVHISSLYPHGASLSQKYVGDLFLVSNLDAYDSIRLFELWIEQQFFENKFSIRAGQLGADEEFATTEHGGLFANATFGWAPMFGLNMAAPAYPSAAPAVRLKIAPSENWYLQAGVYDGNPDPGDAQGRFVNANGVRINLSEGAVYMIESGLSWGEDEESLPGIIKLGGWGHTADFAHLRLDDNGISTAISGGNPLMKAGNWGLYLASEQMLWRENAGSDEGLGLFTRFGGSPPDRNLIQFYAEGGFHYQGLLPGREQDRFGVGIGYGQISREFRELNRDAGNFPLPDYEAAVEATYLIQLTPWWTFQPDVQWIIHPGGSSANENALVLGLRTSIVF